MSFTFSHIVSRFFNSYLASERNLSANTIASYSDCMRLLIQYVCERLQLEPEKLSMDVFTRELVVEFLAHLETKRNNDAVTTNQRLAAIKTFFHFLARNVPQLMHTNELIQAIRPKKTHHLPPPSLTIPEVHAILAVPDTATLMGARDNTIVKDCLGHVDLKTTSQYVEVSIQRKREAVEKVPAPANDNQPEAPRWKQPSIMNLLSCLSRKARYVA